MNDPLADCRFQLAKRIKDPRSRLMGFDEDVGAIAAALNELEQRQQRTDASLAFFIATTSAAPHEYTCECRPCALARMVRIDQLENQ